MTCTNCKTDPCGCPTPAGLIALAVSKLGCETLEARVQIHGPDTGRGVRVVVSCPDTDTRWLLGALVEALGAELRIPTRLAGGIPLPDLPCLAFRVPATAGAFVPPPKIGIPSG